MKRLRTYSQNNILLSINECPYKGREKTMRRFQQQDNFKPIVYFAHQAMRVGRERSKFMSNEFFKVSTTCLLFGCVGLLTYAADNSAKSYRMFNALEKKLNGIEQELHSIDHEVKWISSRPSRTL